jgi:hypothetical protein
MLSVYTVHCHVWGKKVDFTSYCKGQVWSVYIVLLCLGSKNHRGSWLCNIYIQNNLTEVCGGPSTSDVVNIFIVHCHVWGQKPDFDTYCKWVVYSEYVLLLCLESEDLRGSWLSSIYILNNPPEGCEGPSTSDVNVHCHVWGRKSVFALIVNGYYEVYTVYCCVLGQKTIQVSV